MKIIKSIKQLRANLLVFLTHNMALPFLKLIRKPNPFPYSEANLQQFPAGSLGNDLALFLERKQLELLPYYAKHDIKHILLGYDTTDEGEVCLQCFMLGNRHLSFPVAATVCYGLLTMPEYYRSFIRAFLRGRNSVYIENWTWFDLLDRETNELRKKIDPEALL